MVFTRGCEGSTAARMLSVPGLCMTACTAHLVEHRWGMPHLLGQLPAALHSDSTDHELLCTSSAQLGAASDWKAVHGVGMQPKSSCRLSWVLPYRLLAWASLSRASQWPHLQPDDRTFQCCAWGLCTLLLLLENRWLLITKNLRDLSPGIMRRFFACLYPVLWTAH